ncbi:proteasome complex subunit Rpn13 ubiquitin receptor-domain-containing protein [Massariosphaeria phaeospora]|uniref:Proteasome complex subunit Rpn13 ubiquitin receptor-domain-containing protein n=1 Tax=Massariosphaeria phaeospora TaxID=100035 RepID=A0A7C8MD75_9PLEO|nr:proteasome complex subunit Rpn13 ubiquitin receptor-domain-containing protein [Massariosphaeria phaeospora]
MSIQPLITFKAGQCELLDGKVRPTKTPGYVYLYQGDDDFVHFCWRPREKSRDEPEVDLIMIPGDGSFTPYTGSESGADSDNLRSPTDGRIFVLKFSSSSQRYLFWLQSKSQHSGGDASWFSERDQKIGQVVDLLLNGEEVDVQGELASVQKPSGGDEDDAMEDVEDTDQSANRNRHGSTGGAGADATGGDIREEGEEAREGGADGGRAAAAGSSDASAVVQNFLKSLKGGNLSGNQSSQQDQFTTLLDLLSPNTTIPLIDKAPESLIDALCANLPPIILLLAQEIEDVGEIDPESEVAQAAIQALELDEKKDVLRRVLRSPQMRQSLGSLTVALRDGGLPNVSQALEIDVANGGFMRGGGMPLGGGDAVKAFLEGVKKTVEKDGDEDEDTMDTD